jgi:hypothetical protein
MEELVALGVKPGDQDSAAKSIVALKNEPTDGKLAWEKAQIDAETLSQAVEELKKTADLLVAHVRSLDIQVKILNNKIADLNTELHARELSLKRTTAASGNFQCQSTQLT